MLQARIHAGITRTVRQSFQWAPTLGGECYRFKSGHWSVQYAGQFQWAPTLGGECYLGKLATISRNRLHLSFNGHPPLGVNATSLAILALLVFYAETDQFQWAPTLGGECYACCWRGTPIRACGTRFNGHPPLGVNATPASEIAREIARDAVFQWAPTLGGECYGIVYLITPPLCQGVNALLNISQRF